MSKTKSKRTFLTTRKKLLLASLVIVAAIASVYAFGLSPFNNSKADNGIVELAERGVNLDPPTTGEKSEAELHKDELAAQNKKPSSSEDVGNAAAKKQVTPLITRADQNEVRAYVPGIVEGGGTCTATLSKGSTSISRISEGIANSSVTNCRPIDLSSVQFPQKGQWTLVVSYNSTAASGKTEPTTVEVR